MNFRYNGATLVDKANNAIEAAKEKIIRLIIAYTPDDEETIDRILQDAEEILNATKTTEEVKRNDELDAERKQTFSDEMPHSYGATYDVFRNTLYDEIRTLKQALGSVASLSTLRNKVETFDVAARNAFKCFNALLKTDDEENEIPF